MLGPERRQKIMDILRQDNKVYVSQLAKIFNITEETIRRDLEKLEQQNLLRRSYGGAMLYESTSEDLSFKKRSNINSESKQIIAATAFDLINDGDTIMVDSSTTCQLLLQKLKIHKHLTIITNSVRLMNDLMGSNFTLISTGGTLRTNSCSLTGAQACHTIKNYCVDFAIISCKGLDIAHGIMESNDSESEIKQHMIKQARRTILLADHTKFNKTAFSYCCDFRHISYLVTDIAPSVEWVKTLADNKVHLLY